MRSYILALLLLWVAVQPTEAKLDATSSSERGVHDVDSNGDGKLDMAELKAEYGQLGARELMHFADSNGDHVLDAQEIVALERYADSHT